MKNLFVWPGGKRREFSLIQKSADNTKHKIFVEPFLGSGFAFLNIAGFDEYIINDISIEVVNFFNAVKNQDEKFIKEIKKHINIWENIDITYLRKIYSEEEISDHFLFYTNKWGNDELAKETMKKQLYFNYVRKRYNENLLNNNLKNEDAADFLFLRQYSFSGMLRYSNTGKYNVPYGGFRYNNRSLKNKLEFILSEELKVRLHKTKIFNLDFDIFFKKHVPDNSFVFLDPPYDSEFKSYTDKDFTFEDQIKLANILSKRKFDIFSILLRTKRIEELYSNLKFDIVYFDYSYGINIKNRQDVSTNVKHLYITKGEK